LDDAEQGKVLIVTCALTLAEVLALRGHPRLPPDQALKRKVTEFFKNEYISVQNVTRQVAEFGARPCMGSSNRTERRSSRGLRLGR
jgi:hypothetical protein